MRDVSWHNMGWVLSWLLIPLAIAAVQMTTCTNGSDDAWLTSFLVFTPAALLVLGGIALTQRHHTRTVFLSIPLVVIVPYCVFVAATFLLGTTFQGNHLCSTLADELSFNAYPASWWQPLWAPLQILMLTAYVWLAASCWRKWALRRMPANSTVETDARKSGARGSP